MKSKEGGIWLLQGIHLLLGCVNISEKVHAHARFRLGRLLQAHANSIAEDFSVEKISVRAVHATV